MFEVGVSAFEFFEHEFGGAFFVAVLVGGREVGFGGEGAVGVVVDDFGDAGLGAGVGGGFGEVEAGGLEGVDEEAGAAGVDVVAGDEVDDFGEGVLDAGALGEVGVAGEDGLEAADGEGLAVGDGAAGGVVVVAEVLAGEGGGAAAASVGEDVAALPAGVAHGGVLSGWGLKAKGCRGDCRRQP